MGTRADFYIQHNSKLSKEDWIGSLAWGGYPAGLPDAIMKATDAPTFRHAVTEFAQGRTDFTSADEGWPWPWDSSRMTDYAYVFLPHAATVGINYWGGRRQWPAMSSMMNVQWGVQSGLLLPVSKRRGGERA